MAKSVREVLRNVLEKAEKIFCPCTNGGKQKAENDCSICRGTGQPRAHLIK